MPGFFHPLNTRSTSTKHIFEDIGPNNRLGLEDKNKKVDAKNTKEDGGMFFQVFLNLLNIL